MSGAEAALVVGLISGVIAIIDATKTVYDAAKDAQGQPEAFRKVASRLPLVLSILQRAKTDAKNLDEDAQEELESVMRLCREKAEKLQKIFNKVVRKDDDGWFDRYKKAVGTLGKGSKVEGLMEGILEDIQVIACDKLMGTATEDQLKELGDAIKEMNEMPTSVPDETGSVTQTHRGSGHNIANTGPGTQQMTVGGGSFYHNTISGSADFGGNSIFNTNPTFNNIFNDTQSQPNPLTLSDPLFMVPFDRNERFVGRGDIFSSIKNSFWSKERKHVVLAGWGGIGKTQIAIEYCWQYREQNPTAHILWVYAGNRERFEECFEEIAGNLQLGRPGNEATNARSEISRWFLNSRNKNTLLVIDNANSFEDFFGNASPLRKPFRDFLPRADQAHVLITTRDASVGKKLDKCNLLPVEKLGSEESLLLFNNKLSPGYKEAYNFKDTSQQEKVQCLLTTLDYIPIALSHAASFLDETNMPIREYVEELQKSDANFLSFLDNDNFGLDRQHSDAPVSVVKSWQLSYDLVQKSNPKAAELLCLMSMLDRQAIPKTLLMEADQDLASFEMAVAKLVNLSMVVRGSDRDILSMHQFVQIITKRRLSHDTTIEHFQTEALQKVLQNVEISFNWAFEKQAVLIPHTQKVLQYIPNSSALNDEMLEQDNVESQRILTVFITRHYWNRREYDLCHHWCQELLAVLERLHNLFLKLLGICEIVEYLEDFKKYPDTKVEHLLRDTMGKINDYHSSLTRSASYGYQFGSSEQCRDNYSRCLEEKVLALRILSTHRLDSNAQDLAMQILSWIECHESYLSSDGEDLILTPETQTPKELKAETELYLGITLMGTTREDSDSQSQQRAIGYIHSSLSILQPKIMNKSLMHSKWLAGRLYWVFDFLGQKENADTISSIFFPQSDKNLVEDDWDYHLKRAVIHWERGHVEKAEEEALEAEKGLLKVISDPNSPGSPLISTSTILGMVSFNRERYTEAVVYFKKAVGLVEPVSSRLSLDLSLKLLRCVALERESRHDFGSKPRSRGALRSLLLDKARQIRSAVNDNEMMTAPAIKFLREASQDRSLWSISEETKASYSAFVCLYQAAFASWKLTIPTRDDNQAEVDGFWKSLNTYQEISVAKRVTQGWRQENNLFHHNACCDGCGFDIFGIRHKCSECPDFDFCSSCILNSKSRHRNHRFVPIFSYGATYHTSTNWLQGTVIEDERTLDAHEDEYIWQADVDSQPSFTIKEHWHMKLSMGKGYESEPEEGKRCRSRFKSHYARDWEFPAAGKGPRRRRKSTGEEDFFVGTSVKASPDVWEDLAVHDNVKAWL